MLPNASSFPIPLRPMGVRLETWATMADETGPVLHPDGAWYTGLLSADVPLHDVVKRQIVEHGIAIEDAPVIHSTSWRLSEEPSGEMVVVLTYVVVVDLPAGMTYAFETWPGATPVGIETLGQHGYPKLHAPAEPPMDTRYVDVLHHALRHLAYLNQHDQKVRQVLSEDWKRYLGLLRPAIAALYDPEASLDVA